MWLRAQKVPSVWLQRSAVVFALVAMACQPESVVRPTLDTASLGSEEFSYPYFGQQIRLTLDRTRMVVAGESPVADARSALAGLGIQVTDAGRLPGGLQQLRLTNIANEARAIEAEGRLRASGRMRFVVPAFRPVGGGSPVLFLDRIDVQFREGVTAQQVDDLIARMNLTLIRPPRPDSGFFAYRFRYPADAGIGLLAIAAELDRHELVEWASPDMVSGMALSMAPPPDPFYPLQFHLKNQFANPAGVPVDIDVEQAWSLTSGEKSIHVVVIDDGMQVAHGDLMHAMGGGMGYDLLHHLAEPGESAYSPYCNDTHGTAVGGIIGARHDRTGIAGIAPGITMTIIRGFRGTYSCNSQPPLLQSASENDLAVGINWAWQWAGADVISNSWNNPNNTPNAAITAAINSAVQNGRGGKGSVVVFSAGNSANRQAGHVGAVWYPATLSSVIAVGAIGREGAVANYSPNGPQMALVAPSSQVMSPAGPCFGEVVTTDLLGGAGCNFGPSGAQDYSSGFGGTSAAAPQVAAVAALLLSREPTLTASQVRTRLLANADQWGPAITFGAGKLNAFRTLFVPPPPPPPPLTVTIQAPFNPVRPYSTCLYTANVIHGTPATYAWSVNGQPVGGNSYQYHHTAGAVPFQLTVAVTSTTGQFGSDEVYIGVDPTAAQCFDY